jgi:hypothetical protein
VAEPLVGVGLGIAEPAAGELVDDHELQDPGQRPDRPKGPGPQHGLAAQRPAAVVLAEPQEQAAGPAQPARVGQALDGVQVARGQPWGGAGADPADGADQPSEGVVDAVAGQVEPLGRLGDLRPDLDRAGMIAGLPEQDEELDRPAPVVDQRLGDDGPQEEDGVEGAARP